MNSTIRSVFTAAGIAAAVATSQAAAFAQSPAPVTQTATESHTATIQAIDYTTRMVTLQFADKSLQTIAVGPGVTRFPQLKVGDQVTFTETASLVYSIAKPGATPPPDTATAATMAGAKPGGAATKTVTTIVTIMAIDTTIPSVTIKTADGRITAIKVKDPKNLVGVKVGDKVQVTYTDSLMISVK